MTNTARTRAIPRHAPPTTKVATTRAATPIASKSVSPKRAAPVSPSPSVRIPMTSLWHATHVPLVDRLMDVALSDISGSGSGSGSDGAGDDVRVGVGASSFNSSSNTNNHNNSQTTQINNKDRRILTTLLQFLVAQFGVDTAPAQAASTSCRLQAASAFLAALNYSVFLDAAADKDISFTVERARELRLLTLISLAALCKQLEPEKLRKLFKLNVITDITDMDDSELVVETFQECILSLIQIDPSHRLHERPDPVMFQIAWRTHLAFQNIVESINAAAEKGGVKGLILCEFFLKGILKGLTRIAKQNPTCSQAQLKVLVAIFADCTLMLSRSITSLPILASPGPHHHQPNSIKLMSHPLLLLKHIVNPIVRLAIWNISLQLFISNTLQDLSMCIKSICKEISSKQQSLRKGEKKVSFKHTGFKSAYQTSSALPPERGTLPWLVAEALASTAHVAGFLETIGKWCSLGNTTNRDSEEEKSSSICLLDHKSAFEIIQWTLYTRVYSTRLVQLFLLPFLEQVAAIGGSSNWTECEEIVVGVYNGRIGKEKIELEKGATDTSQQPQSTIHYLTRWLITTACSRIDEKGPVFEGKEDHKSGLTVKQAVATNKLPSAEAMINLRRFSIRLLGILTNGNREISLCLLSLFDDQNPEIRLAAAKALAVRSLNNDPSHFHIPNSTAISVNAVHHREDGTCVFDDPHDAYGIAHWFRQNENDGGGLVTVSRREDRWVGLPSALKAPFKYLVWCLDDCVGYEDVDNRWQGSVEERIAFGQWAYHITEHIFSLCPVVANSKIYPAAPKSSQLPTLSDPRQKAILKVAHDLCSRIESKCPVAQGQPPKEQAPHPYTKEQHFALRHCIVHIATGIVEGSKANATDIPHCDHRVLRAFGITLHHLRHDETPLIRTIVLESLARVLGVGVLIERVRSIQYPSAEIVQDLLPSFSQQTALSPEALSSLAILYRLVRGVHPFEGEDEEVRVLWEPYVDTVESHPGVKALREALLNFGELVHLHAVFRGREFEVKRFGKSHGLAGYGEERRDAGFGGVEIPLGSRFQWTPAHQQKEETAKNDVVQKQKETLEEREKAYRDEVRASLRRSCQVQVQEKQELNSTPNEHVPSRESVILPRNVIDESTILRNIAEEEAKVLEEFRERIQSNEIENLMLSATSNLDQHSPEAVYVPPPKREHPNRRVSQSEDVLFQNGRQSNLMPTRRTSYSQTQVSSLPDEGASILFRKTERYFHDALEAINPGTPAYSTGCLDEELESIISEHENSLKQSAASIRSSTAADFRRGTSSRQSMDSIQNTAQPKVLTEKQQEGPSLFTPIDIGDTSTTADNVPIEIGNLSFMDEKVPNSAHTPVGSPLSRRLSGTAASMSSLSNSTRNDRKKLVHQSEFTLSGSRRTTMIPEEPIFRPQMTSRESPLETLEAVSRKYIIPSQPQSVSSAIGNENNESSPSARRRTEPAVMNSPPRQVITSNQSSPSPKSERRFMPSSSLSSISQPAARSSLHKFDNKASPTGHLLPNQRPAVSVATATSLPSSPRFSTVKAFGSMSVSTAAPSKRDAAVETSLVFIQHESNQKKLVDAGVGNSSSVLSPNSRPVPMIGVTPATPLSQAPPPISSSVPVKLNSSSVGQITSTTSASATAIQNTWLLRRMDYAKSPSQTPAPVKSPSMRSKLSRAGSTSIQDTSPSSPRLAITSGNINNVERYPDSVLLGVADGGRMDVEELSKPDLESDLNRREQELDAKLVTLDAFLAGNGLHIVDANEAGVTTDFGGIEDASQLACDESNFFAENEFIRRSYVDTPQQNEHTDSNNLNDTNSNFGQTFGSSVDDMLKGSESRYGFSRRGSDPFFGGVQYDHQSSHQTPNQTEARKASAPYTGMSVFRNDSMNEPSGIPVTPGSPISFEWTQSQVDVSVANRNQSLLVDQQELDDFEFDEQDQRRMSMELAQRNGIPEMVSSFTDPF
ncbi:hypothetical protein BCR33DRAFT_738071 [Rhizoclosmatium globosum]|uniref:Uncharacterized protein n=1 Tax=Rhizoclosmatium globosum TaxID=329046 RepID=A0A1Y2CCC0_9FUNG|nr:hypothetical protein BCR33DRAFT_738071 [Rhizoclosmatium globosum]|eukprot:ORY44484.1 hypothetical protein BCR33DRAFT_738071 [Rhizoclosmatium globosum]